MKIRFEVKSVRYRKEDTGYTIADITILSHPKEFDVPTTKPVITGDFSDISIGDEFIGEGEWVNAGKYGYQFHVNESLLVLPESAKGMADFLHRNVDGVGKTTAKRIVEHFGESVWEVITSAPERLLEIKGISPKKKDMIHKSVKAQKDFEDVSLFLSELEIGHMDAAKIYEVMGYDAILTISFNPFALLDVSGISFQTADRASVLLGFSSSYGERVKGGILDYISTQMSLKGDMYVERESILRELKTHLSLNGKYVENTEIGEGHILSALEQLEGEGILRSEASRIYTSFYNHIENSLTSLLSDKINSEIKPVATPDELHVYLYEKSVSEDKREGVIMALSNPVSILSGGPGTGKTYTLNAIMDAITHFAPHMSIRLCAPTGKAAKRMTDLTGVEAETIHRLLQISPDKQEQKYIRPITADFLIIDESSMMDAEIFYRLLSAASRKTRVLLVGDHNQLPSVGPGLILRDMMESEVIPTTILNEIFRQEENSALVRNAYNIIQGKGVNSLNIDGERFLLHEIGDTAKITDKILEEVNALLKSGVDMDDIQVLTVLNEGDLGVKELNRKMQQYLNPGKGIYRGLQVKADLTLREGDRVMQTENNYELNVFNGETGKISSIEVTPEKVVIHVQFGERTVAYDKSSWEELILSYAISVHKSQGSEFKHVIMPIHKTLDKLLYRNVIYTAWTRARERVVLIGSRKELELGLSRTENTVRNSELKTKLRN